MLKISVFTGTRAEYGLLYWLMREIQSDAELVLQTVVSGMHLSPEFGETWKVVEQDGFSIDATVEMLLSSNTPVGVAKSIGVGVIGFADVLMRLQPDILVILGDRFEALAIAQVALVLRIPIAHIHGGEITEGAYDDAIRHAITKMATYHFVAAEPYRKRVVQMGEEPRHVFNVGAVGLDHLTRTELLSYDDLSTQLQFSLESPYFLVTYHPVTAANEPVHDSIIALLSALDNYQHYKVIFTYPNADNYGRSIISLLSEYENKHPQRVLVVASLGTKRYLSAMKYAEAIIGNSSSGIIEAPSFCVPTINIGLRQRGRLFADSVIDCEPESSAITKAIQVATSQKFMEQCKGTLNPYGHGNAAQQITSILKNHSTNGPKIFYDFGRDNE